MKSREEINEYNRNYYAKNREYISSYRKKKYLENLEHNRERCRKSYQRNINNIKIRYKIDYSKNSDYIKERIKRAYKIRKDKLFTQILDHYGRKCNCSKCSEITIELLTLEHINNDGAEHRRRVKGQTLGIYRDVIAQGFPDIYEILCHNCNWGRSRFKICPHLNQKT